jgi:ABC-2 type transport system permease protein
MSLGLIVRKEIKEMLTPQTVMPVVVMSLLFAGLGGLLGNIGETVTEKPTVGVVDADQTVLSHIAADYVGRNAKVVYNGTSPQEGMKAVEKSKGLALLVIRQGFTANIINNTTGVVEVRWVMRGAGLTDTISTTGVELLLAGMSQQVSRALVANQTHLNATIVLSPTARNDTTIFKGKTLEGVSPTVVSGMVSGQAFVVPIIILMIVTMSGQMVIASMGMEKETKTLETLMTMPTRRSSIVGGKIIGAAVVGLVSALIYMVGFSVYIGSFTVGGLDPAKYGLSLGVGDYVLIGISLFLAIMGGLSLSMFLGTFAENYKSAQTLSFPIVALALIPMFLTIFLDFDTMPVALRALTFAIPFSHPMMAFRALMFNEYWLVLAGIGYMLLFNAVMILAVVRVFNTDRLLTGRKPLDSLKGGLSKYSVIGHLGRRSGNR